MVAKKEVKEEKEYKVGKGKPPLHSRFSKDHQPAPEKRGPQKGYKTKATIYGRWLDHITTVKNPLTNRSEKIPIEDQLVLVAITKAMAGNLNAFKELMDGRYGVNKGLSIDVPEDGKSITIQFLDKD